MPSLIIEYKGDGHEDKLIERTIMVKDGKVTGDQDSRKIQFEFPDKKTANAALAKLKKAGLSKVIRNFKATIV